MLFDAAQLQALDAAVSEGTLDAAARRLHVTPSAVSQRLRALETATGRVLLIRSRPVQLTPSGEAVLRLARQLALLSDDVAAELGTPDGDAGPIVLALAVNADSLATWFLPALAPLADRIQFRLHRGDEGRTGDLLRQGTVMAAVTTEGRALPGCTVTRLGAMAFRPMAAPQFAERWFPQGATGKALAHAPMLVFDDDDPLQHEYLAAHGAPGARPPLHRIPSSVDFLEAVRLGFGWGMVPDLQSRTMPPGAIVAIQGGEAVAVGLHWQQWRLDTPSLRELSAAVISAGRAALEEAPDAASAP